MWTLEEIHERMVQEIEKAGGRIDGLYVCPHHPDQECDCRKPNPGLLLQAAVELGIDLQRSVFLGDSRSDILAAIRAGVQPVYRIVDGEEKTPSDIESPTGFIRIPAVKDLLEFSKMLAAVAAEGRQPVDVIYYLAASITISEI